MSCLVASTASATQLAYEGFDYPAGPFTVAAAVLNGGTGFTAAWNGDTDGTIVAGGMTYTDTAGKSLQVSGNYVFGNGTSGNFDGQRNFTQRGDAGTTTWWSFLGQRLLSQATQDDSLARAARRSSDCRPQRNFRPERSAGHPATPTLCQRFGNFSIVGQRASNRQRLSPN